MSYEYMYYVSMYVLNIYHIYIRTHLEGMGLSVAHPQPFAQRLSHLPRLSRYLLLSDRWLLSKLVS